MAYSEFGMLSFFDEDEVLNELSVKDANGNETNMDNDPENNQGDTTDYTNMDDGADNGGAANPPAETPEGGENPPGDDTDYTDLGGDDTGADNPDAGNPEDGDQTDYTDLGGDTGDDNGDNTAGADGGDGGVSDDTDYTDLGGDDSGETGEEGAEGDAGSAGGEDGEGDEEGTEGEEGEGKEGDELARIEDELFSDLTSEQNAIKDKELKRLFIELYKMCDTTVNRINAIAKTDNNMRVLTFCAKKIIELRDSIDYHLNETYWTKLYLDNLIIYKTCIAQYNNVNEILKKLIPDEYKNSDIEDMKDETPKELDELNAEDDEFNPDETKDEIEDLNIQ